jgi:phage-related minor tail protein
LASGATRTGRIIESALSKAVSGGKIGFDDLRRVAVSALAEIAQSSIRGLLSAAPGSDGGSSIGLLSGLLGGLPGRATGGPVSPGRPYLVGERGPELFVPPGQGRIEQIGRANNVQVNLSISAPQGSEPQAMQRSSKQIARALRSAILSSR